MTAAARDMVAREAGGTLHKVTELLGGTRLPSRRVTSPLDAHELLLRGLPPSALDHLVRQLVSIHKTDLLEKAVGMSLRTYQRRKDAPAKPPQPGAERPRVEVRRDPGRRAMSSACRLRPNGGWSVLRSGSTSVGRSIFSPRRRASS